MYVYIIVLCICVKDLYNKLNITIIVLYLELRYICQYNETFSSTLVNLNNS